MKKIFLFILCGFVLTIYSNLFATILFKADEIEYNSSFTNENTVQGAINELYGNSNLELKTIVLNNKTTSKVSEKFTPSKNEFAKIICVRGSSNTTLVVNKDDVSIFKITLTENADIMKEVGTVELEANNEYEFVLEGLGNTSTNASAAIIYY